MQDVHAAVSSFFNGDLLSPYVILDLVKLLVMGNRKVVS
jgi:hypothetical protein